jgi:pyridoxal phosphate enzyme (YggS family)
MQTSEKLKNLKKEIDSLKVRLIAVSKTQSVEEILEAYEAGQRDFGENLVQELVEKAEKLPKDIKWHQIGHLQTNKVKYIAPFISVIHSVDSLRILKEINKQALRNERVIDCLLQVHIAEEETKYGLNYDELIDILRSEDIQTLKNIRIIGLMGIATNTKSERVIKEEFYELKTLFAGIKESFFKNDDAFKEVSMGMSSDYKIAIAQGSTMIRVGSLIFGSRPNLD